MVVSGYREDTKYRDKKVNDRLDYFYYLVYDAYGELAAKNYSEEVFRNRIFKEVKICRRNTL